MNSWILTIILTVVLIIVPPIVKAKKEKEEQMRKAHSIPARDEEDAFPSDEEVVSDVAPAEKVDFEEATVVRGDRVPEVKMEEATVISKTDKKEHISIDKKNLVIYSEIMSPKYKDF